MRLINARTLKLEQFVDGRSAPEYAILSHTWCRDEVLFADMAQADDSVKRKKGWKKIAFTCSQALKDGLKYAWVDTCCIPVAPRIAAYLLTKRAGIDKSSSAELSEAINSMFAWYEQSKICYVYLSDVSVDALRSGDLPRIFEEDALNDNYVFDHMPSISEITVEFSRSRWHTRGWTLQELLAPSQHAFYSRDWTYLGSGRSLVDLLTTSTGIERPVLRKLQNIKDCSIARRMSWAASRTTTRIEDEAYSLLGICSINMPLLYGEGVEAFIRLQQEIIRKSRDQSILAWPREGFDISGPHVLASSVRNFASCHSIVPLRRTGNFNLNLTQRGLEMTARVVRRLDKTRILNTHHIILECLDQRFPHHALVLSAWKFDSKDDHFEGLYAVDLFPELLLVPHKDLRSVSRRKRIVVRSLGDESSGTPWQVSNRTLRICCIVDEAERFSVTLLDKYPSRSWEYGHLCTPRFSVCAVRMQVKQKDGSIIMQLVIVFGAKRTLQHPGSRSPHYHWYLQEEHPGDATPLRDICHRFANDTVPTVSQRWLLRHREAFKGLAFTRPRSIGAYEVRCLFVEAPPDDAYSQLLVYIDKPLSIFRVLALGMEALYRAWTADYLSRLWAGKVQSNRATSSDNEKFESQQVKFVEAVEPPAGSVMVYGYNTHNARYLYRMLLKSAWDSSIASKLLPYRPRYHRVARLQTSRPSDYWYDRSESSTTEDFREAD